MSKSFNKSQVIKLHAIAEFQKKCAWATYNTAMKSKMFKEELLAAAKVAADNCRETRQMIREIIERDNDRELNAQGVGNPKFWD